MLRGDLDILGRPIRDRRARVAECLGCMGTGREPLERTHDPYWTGRGA